MADDARVAGQEIQGKGPELTVHIPYSVLLKLGVRRERPEDFLVWSHMSLEKARRAIIAATQDGPPAMDFGEFWLAGDIEGDELDLRWGNVLAPKIVRVKLLAVGDRVRVHAVVSEGRTPIVMWILALAFPFVLLWAFWNSFWPVLSTAVELGRAAVMCALYGIAAFLIFRKPSTPSRLTVDYAKGFLSRALLAEPIEVEATARR